MFFYCPTLSNSTVDNTLMTISILVMKIVVPVINKILASAAKLMTYATSYASNQRP